MCSLLLSIVPITPREHDLSAFFIGAFAFLSFIASAYFSSDWTIGIVVYAFLVALFIAMCYFFKIEGALGSLLGVGLGHLIAIIVRMFPIKTFARGN